MNEKRIIKIPFQGFYESWYSEELDNVEERFAENCIEDDKDNKYAGLSAEDICEVLYWVTQYPLAYEKISEAYVEAFDEIASEQLSFPLGLTWESMTSPKEYNFETDRLFAHISSETALKLFNLVFASDEGRAAFDNQLEDRHTSYSGFYSYYSNDSAQWLAKPFEKWDHNELETLLLAALAMVSTVADQRDFAQNIYERVSESDVFDTAFDAAVDWDDFDKRIAEKKADLATTEN